MRDDGDGRRVTRKRRTSRRVWVVQGALVVATVLVALFAHRAVTMVSVAENWVADLRLTFFNPVTAQHPDIVILAITEDTLATLSYRSPVDRAFLTGLLDTLDKAGARAVGLDILFDQPSEPDKDATLRRRLLSMPVPVVVGWTDRATGLTERQYAFQAEYLDGVHAGYSNLAKDPADGTVREIFPGRAEDGVFRPSFAAMLAEALGFDAPREPVPLAYRGRPQEGTPPFRTFPAHAAAVLPAAWLAGKVVMIGADLPFADRHRTPFAAGLGVGEGDRPGVEIQAQILAQIMDGRFDDGTSLPLEVVIAVALALAAAALTLTNQPVPAKLAEAAGALALLWAGSAWAFIEFGLALPVVAPSVAFAAAFGLGSAHRAAVHRRETQFIADAFSHYLSPALVTRFRADPEGLMLGGAKRSVTLVFTDVEGFTAMSEDLEPTDVVAILNAYLDGLSQTVIDGGGMIDKFIGDAVMAVFGAPDDQPDHADRAVACALAMQAFGRRFAAEQRQRGIAFGRTRIGVHSGDAVVGNIGGRMRFDYTAIGDTVNTAARLEGANKALGTDICVSADTAARATGHRFRPIGRLSVQGRQEDIAAFTPVAPADADRATAYEAAYALLAVGDARARAAFERHLEDDPDDALAAFHLRRIRDGVVSDRIVLEGK